MQASTASSGLSQSLSPSCAAVELISYACHHGVQIIAYLSREELLETERVHVSDELQMDARCFAGFSLSCASSGVGADVTAAAADAALLASAHAVLLSKATLLRLKNLLRVLRLWVRLSVCWLLSGMWLSLLCWCATVRQIRPHSHALERSCRSNNDHPLVRIQISNSLSLTLSCGVPTAPNLSQGAHSTSDDVRIAGLARIR